MIVQYSTQYSQKDPFEFSKCCTEWERERTVGDVGAFLLHVLKSFYRCLSLSRSPSLLLSHTLGPCAVDLSRADAESNGEKNWGERTDRGREGGARGIERERSKFSNICMSMPGIWLFLMVKQMFDLCLNIWNRSSCLYWYVWCW